MASFSNKFINIIILITLSIGILIFLKYIKSDYFFSGFYFNFLIYTSIFFFICIVFLLQKSNFLKIIFIYIIFIFGITLYSFEIYLHFLDPVDDLTYRQLQAKKIGKQFDNRTKLAVVLDLEERGEVIVPSVPPNDILHKTKKLGDQIEDKIYPVSGISNIKTVFCNESGKRITYFSDIHGFRNKNQIWKNKDVDIVILGDSHVHGACVEDNDMTSNILSNITDKTVLNLGFQGHGPLMQIAALKEYGIKKKPSVVIWYYFESNDLGNLIDEINSGIFNKYKQKDFSQNLSQNQEIIDKNLNKLISLTKLRSNSKKTNTKNIKLINIIKLTNFRNIITPFFPVDRSLVKYRYSPINQLEEYFLILGIAKRIVEEWEGEFYFVYHPHPSRYTKRSFIHHYGIRQYENFLEKLSDRNIKVIDFKKDLFDKINDPKKLYHFGITGHPNENGYRISAEYLANELSKLK